MSSRQKRLEGKTYGTGTYDGKTFDRWQYEATSGGRIFYFVDDPTAGGTKKAVRKGRGPKPRRRVIDQTWHVALWDERIGSSGAWEEVQAAQSKFAELAEEHAGHQALVRPSHLVSLLAARLRGLDPHMATDQMLNGVESKVSALRTQVGQVFEPAEGQEPATAAHEQHSGAKEQLDSMVLTAAKRFEDEEQRERAAHDALIEEQTAAGSTHLQQIEELKAKVENLVGAVGRSGLTAGFQQWEKAEQKQADQMRIVAIRHRRPLRRPVTPGLHNPVRRRLHRVPAGSCERRADAYSPRTTL